MKGKFTPKPRKEAEKEILKIYHKFFDGWKYRIDKKGNAR